MGRDPRERVATVAYYALVQLSDHRVQAATDARAAAWFAVDDLPGLAFDHDRIDAIRREGLKKMERHHVHLHVHLHADEADGRRELNRIEIEHQQAL